MYFKQKLAHGQLWEDKAKLFITQYKNVEVVEEQNKDNYSTMHYDFKTSDGISYEVKADKRSFSTGNFFIEYSGYGKPTGIRITTADKHILTDEQQFYIIRTSKIIKLLRDNTYKDGYVKGSDTWGSLIPKADIIKHARVFECVWDIVFIHMERFCGKYGKYLTNMEDSMECVEFHWQSMEVVWNVDVHKHLVCYSFTCKVQVLNEENT